MRHLSSPFKIWPWKYVNAVANCTPLTALLLEPTRPKDFFFGCQTAQSLDSKVRVVGKFMIFVSVPKKEDGRLRLAQDLFVQFMRVDHANELDQSRV